MDNLQEGNRTRADASTKNLPPSFLHSSRQTNKKYMEAIAEMKNTANPPNYINFKSTTKLLEDQRFNSAKYILQYMKKAKPHVQVFSDQEGNHPINSK
uniref:Uncharacterized protein n=1 Tax=Avena sativa TaxID=4498 RepID=A0ACD6AKL9_AVESA